MLPESDYGSETIPYVESSCSSVGGESNDSSDTEKRPVRPAHSRRLPERYRDNANERGAEYAKLSARSKLSIFTDNGLKQTSFV